MNTSSYSPISLGTYNFWRVEFVFKQKMTKTSIQRRLWWNFIQGGLVVPIFIHSISLLFEGNALLKCVSSGSSHITTVSWCYRKLNAHIYGAPWQKYHAPDTWHNTIPGHIILTLGWPILALPHKYTLVTLFSCFTRKYLSHILLSHILYCAQLPSVCFTMKLLFSPLKYIVYKCHSSNI